jgi:putative redox protein
MLQPYDASLITWRLKKGASLLVMITIAYDGDLHCRAVHEPSGTALATDAPVDNQGKGESFSPTDLIATALGTCILTVMGIKAQALGLDIAGSTATVEKAMAMAPTRRIGMLAAQVHIPHDIASDDQRRLEAAAHSCPVHKSLHPDIDAPITFYWGA